MKQAFSLILVLLLALSPLSVQGEIESSPDPAIRFMPEDSLPLPSETYALTEKRPFAFGGTVVSLAPLIRVSVTVTDEQAQILLQEEATFDPAEDPVTSFPLWDRTYPFADESLSGRMDFASLAPGRYTFTLRAASDGHEATLYSSPFTVAKITDLHTLMPNDLRGTYLSAAAYLGEDNLPFTYRTGTYNQIRIDNAWVGRNIVEINTPFDAPWRVNRAAVEPFERAISYLRHTYVHVGGKWDSNILRLSFLVAAYNGPYYARQEENTPFLSPHVLGLAVDLNHSIGPNEPAPDNWDIFCKEISENLIYNGIKTKDGRQYYDFTYIGNWGTEYQRVPTVIQNYLLYELAFFRAGFFWGVYYDHTCDASHFGLGEYDPAVHTDSPLALRKVFEYIDD